MNNHLIIMGKFLPSSKDGGPIKTIVNLINRFKENSNFFILTGDRDVGDRKSFANVSINKWTKAFGFNICYLKKGNFSFSNIKKFSKNIDGSILLCGVFSSYVIKALILKKIGLLSQPIYILPMGTFSKGALKIKKLRKKIYFLILNSFKLFQNINWIVSSQFEKKDLTNTLPNIKKIIVFSDLPNKPDLNIKIKTNYPNIKVIFLSRISPKKNLDYAISIISKLKFNLEFNIYGNIEDSNYWTQCLSLLNNLPRNIKWNYLGHIPPSEVDKVFQNHDVFFFPTRGENFGHVIFEALSNGCIPLISDQTPWNDISEYYCGKVVSLERSDEFVKYFNYLHSLNKMNLILLKKNCLQYSQIKYSQLNNQSNLDFLNN